MKAPASRKRPPEGENPANLGGRPESLAPASAPSSARGPSPALSGLSDPAAFKAALLAAPYETAVAIHAEVLRSNDVGLMRWFCLNDRYFLMVHALGVGVALHPWVYERCREVEADPDEWLDLWSRGHFKSTIITYAGVVQYVLNDPEAAVCIMSYKSAAAQQFVAQIKYAFETSTVLLACFPDVLWADRATHAGDRWSVQGGIVVRRKGGRKEATVDSSGLVEGMRTGGHYDLLVYDDTVTMDSVSTPEQSQKTTDAWSMSLNLGTELTKHWYIGTRYALFDTYADMMRLGVRERRHVGIGADGRPVYWSEAEFERRKRLMSMKDWASQILQEPVGDGELVFRADWWRTYDAAPGRERMNVYVLVDSANSKDRGRDSDYTVMTVWGLASDRHYYLLDAIRDRLNLAERTDALFGLVQRWMPKTVFWEQVGAMSDVQHVQSEMGRRGWHFAIVSLRQSVAKRDRIMWLEPLWREGLLLVPRRLARRRVTGDEYDFCHELMHDEFLAYPSVRHDDMLDCMANLRHPTFVQGAGFPVAPWADGDGRGGVCMDGDRVVTKGHSWRPW